MPPLSSRMLQAGWTLSNPLPDHFEARSPAGPLFTYRRNTTWSPPLPELETRLQADEHAIASGEHTPFLGTARLAAPPLHGRPTLLADHLAREGIAHGHAVLRLLTNPDPAGDDTLLASGAWRVESLTSPWHLPSHGGPAPFHLVLCEHVIDCLPPSDRSRIFHLVAKHLHHHGLAYFSLFQMSAMPDPSILTPFEDGYQVSYGPHRVFLRPYTESMARREFSRHLEGTLQTSWIHFHELVTCWHPRA